MNGRRTKKEATNVKLDMRITEVEVENRMKDETEKRMCRRRVTRNGLDGIHLDFFLLRVSLSTVSDDQRTREPLGSLPVRNTILTVPCIERYRGRECSLVLHPYARYHRWAQELRTPTRRTPNEENVDEGI